jgi:N-acyl-D-amino-acid deacylase
MGSELVTFGTDGLFGGRPHPRVHGTYPRILGRYVREEKVLSLAEAVRKATSLAARAMGLSRKGLLRPGMDADVVVFDPVAVEARATYDEPTRPPVGVSDVFVGGEPVVAGGEPTGATPGETIRA